MKDASIAVEDELAICSKKSNLTVILRTKRKRANIKVSTENH